MAGGVDIDLLLLGRSITTGEQELVLILRNRVSALDVDVLGERVGARWGTEAARHQVDEAVPGGNTLVAL
jgi:predicted lipid carrier protein YhbT